jgi:4-hydroxy-4-methyl-2-oxoglutarate aldolase
MMNIAVRNIQRAKSELVNAFGSIGVATIHEAQGRTGYLGAGIRPVNRGPHISGSALTVLATPNDNWMIHVAIELALPGDILLVGMTAPCTDGAFGDLLAVACQARGIRGLVSDAGVRDIDALRDMNFPVWSRAISAQGTVKENPGAVNVPITIGGSVINPGDVIVADSDGVVCVPRNTADAVLDASQERDTKEHDIRTALQQGESSMDLFGLRTGLEAKGFTYVDKAKDK